MKGNEAVALGALYARCNAYFAYPITPSTEVAETFAREFGSSEFPDYKVFLQASSELEAINMVLGAAATGARACTATASPGFSLKQEAISYAAGMELPALIVNVNRGGPGLGSLGPEQSDYFQATRGGGHGGYRMPVLAPASVQEIASFPVIGFELAFRYRNPVLMLMDAYIGQIKEDIIFPKVPPVHDETPWAVTGAKDRKPNILNSLHLDVDEHERHVEKLLKKYEDMAKREVRFEEYLTGDAEVVMVAFGIVARLCKRVVNLARKKGLRLGLLRPITLFPFPYRVVADLSTRVKGFLVVELNTGQMVEDVRLGVEGRTKVHHHRRVGGTVPTHREILEKAEKVLGGG